jgi:hypothetical protein
MNKASYSVLQWREEDERQTKAVSSEECISQEHLEDGAPWLTDNTNRNSLLRSVSLQHNRYKPALGMTEASLTHVMMNAFTPSLLSICFLLRKFKSQAIQNSMLSKQKFT